MLKPAMARSTEGHRNQSICRASNLHGIGKRTPSALSYILSAILTLAFFSPWPQDARAAWEVTHFKVKTELPPRNRGPVDVAEMVSEFIEDVIWDDLSDEQKLAQDAWARLIEREMHDIATRLSNSGLIEPISLPRDEETGHYLIYVYPFVKFDLDGKNDYGVKYANHCSGIYLGSNHIGINSDVYNFSQSLNKTGDPKDLDHRDLYNTLAHELFHAVQFEYDQYFKSTRACDAYDNVQVEGTAAAVGTFVTEQRYPGYLRSSRRESVLGVWLYALPFLEATKHSYGILALDGKIDEQMLRKNAYKTSGFWRFLMERYGGLQVMDHLFRRPMPGTGTVRSDHVIAWLDRGLQHSSLVDLPLYLVFPEFSADMVEWAKHRYSPEAIDEQRWFNEVLSCYGVPDWKKPTSGIELTPDEPTKTVTFKLSELSINCMQVKARGFQEGQQIAIKTIAYAKSKEDLDALHMGAGRMLSKRVEDKQPHHCYQLSRNMGYTRVPVCLEKPYLGRMDRSSASQSAIEQRIADQFPISEEGGRHSRTWMSHAQHWDPEFENVMTIARVSPKPTLSDAVYEYTLDFAVEFAEMKSSEGVDTHSPGVDINLPGNTNPVPIDESEIIKAAPDRDDLTQMIFLQQGGTGMAKHMLREAFDGGVGVINFVSADMDHGDDQEMMGADQFQVAIADGGVPFGTTGNFDVGITTGTSMMLGGQTSDTMIMGLMQDRPDGTISIKQFDDQMLRGTLTVSYCRVGNFDFERKKCKQVETASLEFTKPFGWAYDINQSFTSIDSPGMRMYRKLSGDLLFGDSGMDWSEIQELGWNPIPPKSHRANRGDSGAGTTSTGEGGSSELCVCSCDELKAIEAAADKMDDTLAEDQMPDFSDPVFKKVMTCSMQCMMAYARCEN